MLKYTYGGVWVGVQFACFSGLHWISCRPPFTKINLQIVLLVLLIGPTSGTLLLFFMHTLVFLSLMVQDKLRVQYYKMLLIQAFFLQF